MLLELYFEKFGGSVEEVITIPAEQAAIITFKEEEGIVQVQFYLYSTFTTATRLTKVLYRTPRLKEDITCLTTKIKAT